MAQFGNYLKTYAKSWARLGADLDGYAKFSERMLSCSRKTTCSGCLCTAHCSVFSREAAMFTTVISGRDALECPCRARLLLYCFLAAQFSSSLKCVLRCPSSPPPLPPSLLSFVPCTRLVSPHNSLISPSPPTILRAQDTVHEARGLGGFPQQISGRRKHDPLLATNLRR